MKKIYQLMICLLLMYGATSCKEEEVLAPDQGKNPLKASSVYNVSYPLDWENVKYMPVAPGQKEPEAPWETGASTGIDFDMLYDYKRADGWELLYNIFNNQRTETNGYFILYNKYRGIIRLYYFTGQYPKESKHMVHNLSLAGSGTTSSPLLDFADQEVVDFNMRSRIASTVEKDLYRANTWYAFEYELAYDSKIPAYNKSSYSIIWDMKALNIQDFKANGSGTITGNMPTFSAPGINLTLSPNYTNKSNTGIQITSTNQVNDTPTGSSSWLTTAIKAGLSKAITSGVSGIATNILSGIFTKKKDNSGNSMALKLKSTTSLTGTIESNFGLPRLTLPVPGYGDPDYAYGYNKVPGIFYISSRPTVQQKVIHYAKQTEFGGGYDLDGSYYTNTYNSPSNFQLVFNPEVLKIASIQNIKYEMVLLNDGEITSGRIETIGDKQYAVGAVAGYKTSAEPSTEGFVGLRVSFKVVPNDGTPAVLIVKTFKCNIVTTNQFITY
ncbi:hypothetical protein I2I11_00830 [Pontibacter sp. 172403-2]|uniref:hypothetical protein n=1 Tax=Pontibacter rufus TaxID=2791028 RepID=UPI0018AF9294|nr:hypothetical protein [Pontibacter sp. 172403-2]MBF9251828.1 hypothetical protein [Pontibacter sp. 172403-2]